MLPFKRVNVCGSSHLVQWVKDPALSHICGLGGMVPPKEKKKKKTEYFKICRGLHTM